MKRFVLLLFVLLAPLAVADSPDLLKYVPENSSLVVYADFTRLRSNDVYSEMEASGRVWSTEDESETHAWLKKLKLNPAGDVTAFVYATYLNAYGNGGTLRIFQLSRDAGGRGTDATDYLGHKLLRVDPDDSVYAVFLTPRVLVLGDLNEAKMAVDVAAEKLGALRGNKQMSALMTKIPEQAAVWGTAIPLTRRQAAVTKSKQSTNALLQSFRNYYFYGTPSKESGIAHFYGQANDEKEALFVNTFAIGTLTFARLRSDEAVAEILDQVNVEQNGDIIHVSATVTKALVDAYLRGDLGVK